ncbi:protein phosphatase 2C domain-containing protein [Streptomyces subrutilus]|nr:protein phosphatase 2C domain-containing protein [Streptomyces subrutilus]
MSQQGADDWWQKLYEDPDAAAAPDPGDTLDHRFRSAAVLTTPPTVPPQAPPPPPATTAHPPPPAAPASGIPEPPPRPSPAPAQQPPRAAAPPPPPPPPAAPAGPQPPPRAPGAAAESAPPPAPPAPPAVAEPSEPPVPRAEGPALPPPVPAVPPAPARRREGLLPGPRQGGSGPGATPAVPPPPATAPATTPAPPPPADPPADPRIGGVTGYALGGVAVPPVSDGPGGGPPRAPVAPPPGARPVVRHLGDRAPTYAAEPGALPRTDPAAVDTLTPDTVLEGARYGTYTLRAASVRGDSARYRGEPRRDHLLTARFGSGDEALVLVVLAGGDRAAPGAAEAAADLCRTVAAAVGRSRERLAADILAGHREALRSGLQRLTDRGHGRLRARAAELGLAEGAYTAGLRGLLLPVDPRCSTRICFGAGAGGLFRLRAGRWQDLEPGAPDGPAGADFRFRASVARPGDVLLLCSGGLAEPMREEASLSAELTARWSAPEPPGLAAFLADTQLRLKGYADDRTTAAVWEA